MRRVVIICEGQTEEQFVGRVMAPAFFELGLSLAGITLPTSAGHKGGALSVERLMRGICNELSRSSTHAVSTLVDLYQLDSSFPGYENQPSQAALTSRLHHLEGALHHCVLQRTGCRPERFIAHVQPHEFEALLFSHLPAFEAVEAAWSPRLAPLQAARDAAQNPEHINDGPTTHPSARLQAALPGYRKLRHGPVVASHVGLARMEASCPHFAAWLARLRRL